MVDISPINSINIENLVPGLTNISHTPLDINLLVGNNKNMLNTMITKYNNINSDQHTLKLSNVFFLSSSFSATYDGKYKKFNALFDTGATVCIMPRQFCTALKVNLTSSKTPFVLNDFTGSPHKVSGDIAPVWVKPPHANGKSYLVNFLVTETGQNILFNIIVASQIFQAHICINSPIDHNALYQLTIDAIYNKIAPPPQQPTTNKIPENINKLITLNKSVSSCCTFPASAYTLPRSDNNVSICSLAKPKNYQINSKFHQALEDHIQSLIDSKTVAEVPKGHKGFQIMWTPKVQPDKVRFCVDCTPINVYIQIGAPTFDSPFDIIDKLRQENNKFFTQIDIKNAFHTIPIDVGNDDHLWFYYKNKKYSWRRMPFGLKDAPNHFNTVLKNILKNIPHTHIYFDNILIATTTLQINYDTTANILKELNNYNIPINSEKSIWFTNTMPFLGMIISDKGVQADLTRIEAIANYPTPTTVKSLQSFLGTVNYNRPFQIRTANLTEQLYKITTSSPKKFPPDTQKTVENLCQQIRDTVGNSILLNNIPKNINDVKWIIYTDASDVGIAGAVGWTDPIEPKDFNILGLHSRALSSTERCYSVPRKELLAMTETILKYEYILRNVHFTAYTDNISLVSDSGLKNEQSRPEINWWAKLREFDFERIHIAGTENTLADAFSRNFTEETITNATNNTQENSPTTPQLSINNTSLALINITSEQYETIMNAHNRGHWGPHIVASILDNENKNWPHRKEMIKEICGKCAICRIYNPGVRHYFTPRSIHGDSPMNYIEFDIAGPMNIEFDKKIIFIVIDVFSSFCWLIPIEDKKSKTLISKLSHIFACHGFPDIVQSDNAKEFKSEEITNWLSSHNITIKKSAEYSQRSNGRVERHVGIMKQLLKKIKLERSTTVDEWTQLIDYVQIAINNRPLQGINVTPLQILNGRSQQNNSSSLYSPSSIPNHAWNTQVNNMQTNWYDFINEWQTTRINSSNRDFCNRHKIDDSPVSLNSLVFYKEQGNQLSWDSNYWSGPAYITSINENSSFTINLCNTPPNNNFNRIFPRDQLHIVEPASEYLNPDALDPISISTTNDIESSNAVNPSIIIALIAARLNIFSPTLEELRESDPDSGNIDFNHYDIMFQWMNEVDKTIKSSWIHSSKLPKSAIEKFFDPNLFTEDSSFYCHYSPFFKQ